MAKVHKHLDEDRPPSVIVFHLGPYSLNDQPIQDIRNSIKKLISTIIQDKPYCRLIWSDMLPQQYYPGSMAFEDVDRSRVLLNRFCRRLCLTSLGGGVIKYPEITWQNRKLFAFGGVYLSKPGEDIFLERLQCAINAFLDNPTIQVYPPSVTEASVDE